MNKDILWDVIVIGGGPAGMMAAGTAAQKGARVLLIEKNKGLGKKLLITGGGRCNVTNSELDNRKFLQKFKDSSKFLFSAFSIWSVKETLEFFHSRSMPTKVERELRTFPVSDSAQSVWDVLVQNLQKNDVTVLSDSKVVRVISEDGIVTGVELAGKKLINGKCIIVATGGTSRPETGSTGDGYKWLRNLGHNIKEPIASLVPIALRDEWAKTLAGVTFTDIKLSLWQNGALQDKATGKILFTHVGISGPTVLNMSRDVAELLKYGPVEITLDLLPKLNYGDLNLELQKIFSLNATKKFKNSLGSLTTGAMTNVIVMLSGINPDKTSNAVSRGERLRLVHLLKAVPMHIDHLLGLDKAIISSGGVQLSEVDFKTMKSKMYPNLFLIGDILDIDRPSGGYSLQLCWTTGHVAGINAAKFSK